MYPLFLHFPINLVITLTSYFSSYLKPTFRDQWVCSTEISSTIVIPYPPFSSLFRWMRKVVGSTTGNVNTAWGLFQISEIVTSACPLKPPYPQSAKWWMGVQHWNTSLCSSDSLIMRVRLYNTSAPFLLKAALLFVPFLNSISETLRMKNFSFLSRWVREKSILGFTGFLALIVLDFGVFSFQMFTFCFVVSSCYSFLSC